jgi:hypothetical protein
MPDQYVQKNRGSGTTSATVTLTGVTAGNAIVAFLFDGASSSPTTKTVNDGTAYTAGLTAADAGNAVWGGIFTLQNAAGGDHTIVGTLDAGAGVELFVFEIQAPTSGAILDTKAFFSNSPGTGTDGITSGTLTIGSAATVVAISTASNTTSAGSIPNAGTGFTSRESGTSATIGAWRTETGAFSSNHGGTFTAPVGTDGFVTLAVAVANVSSIVDEDFFLNTTAPAVAPLVGVWG